MGTAEVAIVGVGTTSFGVHPGKDSYDLGMLALRDALEDCGLGFGDIDGMIVNRIPDYQRLAAMAGIDLRFVTITPGQGRFSAICIDMARSVIASGSADIVALVYGNDGRTANMRYGGAGDTYGGSSIWFPYGMSSPGAYHALMMRRHMELYGTTQDQLGVVATTFRRHASLNPQAVMRKPFTIEEYRAARYICEPLRILDYCLINDGGVALIMTSGERARDMKGLPVYLRGSAIETSFKDSAFPPQDFWYAPARRATARSFAQASLTNADMSALMIYDNFTPTVLFSLEGFGYCGQGESGPWAEEGYLSLGNRYPTNTSGGHLSESYVQGWALNVEAVRQLRGECGERQVKEATNIHFMAAAPVVSSLVYSRHPS